MSCDRRGESPDHGSERCPCASGPQDPDWYELGWYEPQGLAGALVEAAARRADAVIEHVSPDRPSRTTLGEIHASARRVLAGLRSLGARPQDVVLVQLPSWAEGAVVLQACVLGGLVLVPIVPTATAVELVDLAGRAGARFAVTATRWRDRDRTSEVDALSAVVERVVLVDIADEGAGRTVGWEWLARFDPATLAPRPDPDATGFVIFTSGSTGTPKGVRHSHQTVLAEARGGPAGTRDAAAPGSTVLHVLPPGHIADLLVLVRSMSVGIDTVVLDRWHAATALQLLADRGVTSTSMTPFHLRQLLDAATDDRQPLAALEQLLVGAAAVTPDLVHAADRLGWPAFRCYGASEHPSVTASSPDDELDARGGSDGRPLPGNEVRIVDARLAELPVGEEGEILTRGPERALGYLDPADDAETFLAGGWYRSGDLGRVGPDGRLIVSGRIKDVVIRNGENISAREVEEALATHPDVADVAVIAVADERCGERACAVVVSRAGAVPRLEELAAHVAERGLARYKLPEELVVVDRLPRTASGKVRKAELTRYRTGLGAR